MMRSRAIIAFALISILGILSARGSAPERKIKIMTYNIRNGIGTDKRVDLDSVARTILASGAEIIGIQEVDSMTRRSNDRYILGELAKSTGMKAIYCPAIDYDGGRYGIGLLCRTLPDSVIRLSLPGREEARAGIIALWPEIALGCTHLSLTPEDRDSGAKAIAEALIGLGGERKVIVLLGDFNAGYEEAIFNELDAGFGLKRCYDEHPTYPAENPTEMIDHILLRQTTTSVNAPEVATIESEASDHRPLVMTLRLNDN